MRKVLGVAVALSVSALTTPIAKADEKIGNWLYTELIDKMTDKKRYNISVVSLDKKALFAIKCDEVGFRTLYSQLISDSYLGKCSCPSRDFTYRIDNGKPITQSWKYDDHSALFFEHENVKKFEKAKSLIVRFSDFDFNTFDAEFDLAGADLAIPRVMQECGGS